MNKRWMLGLAVVGSLTLGVPPEAAGADFVVADNDRDSVSTAADTQADVFMAGNIVTVENEVADDVWAAGNLVEVKGVVGQDVIVAGQTVNITAPVGDDIMAAGEVVRIQAGSVDDVMAAGQTVEIFDTSISGSAYLAGQQVIVSGQVDGNIRVAAENVTIKSGTVINGNLISYGGEQQPFIEEGVTIGGEKQHHVSDFGKDDSDRNEVWSWVRGVVAWFVLAMVLMYGLPHWSRQVVGMATGRSGKSLLWGFLALLLYIPLMILLLISLVGWPIALGGGLLLGGLMVLAGAFSALAVGSWLLRKFTKNDKHDVAWQDALLGVVVIKGVALVPGVGPVLVLVVFILALGAELVSLFDNLRGSSNKIQSESAN